MTFTYGALEVTLRNPEWSNSFDNMLNNIVRRLRCGELRSFRPTNRQTRVRVSLVSKANTLAVITAFEALVAASRGMIVEMELLGDDYEIIIAQDTISRVTVKDTCSYTVTLDIDIVEVPS